MRGIQRDPLLLFTELKIHMTVGWVITNDKVLFTLKDLVARESWD